MKKLTLDDFEALAGTPTVGKFRKCTIANDKE
jgi:hypothetical protein